MSNKKKNQPKKDELQKLEQECAICGERPAYYSELADDYVCLNHLIRIIINYIAKAAIVVAAILATAYLIF